MSAAASPSSAGAAAAHTTRDLERLSAQPENKVLRWAEPGERRRDAFSAEVLCVLVDRLKERVVTVVRGRPGTNELMLRMELGAERVGEPAPESYTWADFAAFYPTFWSKITSASSTRRDMMTIQAMLSARRDFERGTSPAADEKELEALIQSDLVALNMQKAEGGKGGKGSREGAAAKGANSSEVRRALEQARLRRVVLERAFGDVRVPAEELAAEGTLFAPARSCLHEIVEEHEQLAAKAGRAGRAGRGGGKAQEPLPGPVVRFARRLLELRVNIAKQKGAMPEELEPKGATFMPTFVRSAQLDLEWRDQWWGVPEEEKEEKGEEGAVEGA